MALAGKVRIAWRAAADQIDHAYLTNGRKDSRETLCGQRVVDIRLAWPPTVKCPDCASMLVDKRSAA